MHNNIVKSEIIRVKKAFNLILLNHISQATYKIRNGERHLSELTEQKSGKKPGYFIRATTCNPFEREKKPFTISQTLSLLPPAHHGEVEVGSV